MLISSSNKDTVPLHLLLKESTEMMKRPDHGYFYRNLSSMHAMLYPL